MTRPATGALQQALAFLREPVGAFAPALPDDVRPLLRIAAADAAALELAALETGEPPGRLRDAASLFLQRVLFAEDGDSYRILGASPDVSEERLREHYRWLVRWLHPDRNPDDWEAEYLYRVNRAWQDLRTSERRRAFDACNGNRPEREQARPARTGMPSALYAPLPTTVSASQWLPRLVLGVLGTAAACGLVWLHATQGAVEDFARVVAGAPPRPAAPVPPTTRAAPALPPMRADDDAGTRPPPGEHASGSPSALDDSSITLAEARASRIAHAPPLRALQQQPRTGRATTARAPPERRSGSVEAPLSLTRARSFAAKPPVSSLASKSASHENVRVAGPGAAASVTSLPLHAPHAHAAPLLPAPAPLDKAEAQALVSRFGRAYEAGDVSALAALLTRIDADSRERREMLREYRQLFRASRQRRMELSRISVVGSGDTGAVIANFSASMIERDASRHDSSGDIRFDLLREAGDLRIHQVRHEARD